MELTPSESLLGRREFVKGAAALAFAHAVAGTAQLSQNANGTSKIRAYVGTYTGAPGAGGNGEGIYTFEMDASSGELTSGMLVAKTPSPAWITIHPSKKYLYAVNEVKNFSGNSGSVSAFAIGIGGGLTALNVVSSCGAGPCYLSISGDGKFAFVANYVAGTAAVLPILEDGRLGDATDVRRDTGSAGSAQASNGPRGSYAISGHDAPHSHMILPDPQCRYVLATDLGQDRIYVYSLDRSNGLLKQIGSTEDTRLPAGDGPRHLAFHPNGKWLYSIQEEASTVTFFHYEPETGRLVSRQTISSLPVGFQGTSFASEIVVSSDGRFVYAANRLHDTIATLAIGEDGTLAWVGETSTMGDYPGQFRIDPTGQYLFACNLRSDNITGFRIDRRSGLPAFLGRYTAVGSPGSITFLA